jgi:hypothetical protein
MGREPPSEPGTKRKIFTISRYGWELCYQSLPGSASDHRGALSAIMIVGALVLVGVTAGIAEASMTLRPWSPSTRSSLSTTATACVSIRQVQSSMWT